MLRDYASGSAKAVFGFFLRFTDKKIYWADLRKLPGELGIHGAQG